METRLFNTHEEIDLYYRKQGVDVDKLIREMEEATKLVEIAIRNVKKRKWFFGLFYNAFNGFSLKKEVQIEFDRLDEVLIKSKAKRRKR